MARPEGDDRDRPLDDLEEIRRILGKAVARLSPPRLRDSLEDIVQDAMIRVTRTLGRGERNGIRSPSYLWQVAFTAMVDELRRRDRRREVVAGDGLLEHLEGVAGADPAGSEASSELGREIRDCLGRLAAARRQVVALHLNGFNAEESARILGYDIRRIRNLTFRGLGDLRRCLEKKGIRP